MPIGNGNKHKFNREPQAVALRFSRGRLVVALDDEREVSLPLRRYPTLLNATSKQRAEWQLIGRGQGFHWPALDLDLSVRGLISGLPEVVPAPPPAKRLTRRSA